MEEYFYIILLVIWLVVSVVKKNAKSKEQASKPKPQRDSSTSRPKEPNLEDILEDFFGGGKKSGQGQPKVEVEEEPSVTYQANEASGRSESFKEALPSDQDKAYQSWESLAQQSYNEGKMKPSQAEYSEPQYEGFYKDVDNQDYRGISEVGKVASVEDLIRSHAAKDAMEQAKAEMAYGGGLAEDIPEFDLRTAVIFSEILNKKYNT